jgi:uncharacterized repeat protein (TIGR01451 family)
MKNPFTPSNFLHRAKGELLLSFIVAIGIIAPLSAAGQNLEVSLPDYTICAGSSDTLMPLVSGGTPPYNYAWSPAADLSCTDCANPIASPTGAITYSLTVTDQAGGEATATTHVTVLLPSPTTQVHASICQGDVYIVGDWFFNTTGIFDVLVTSAAGCDSTVRLHLNVFNNPMTFLNATICQGETYFIGGQGYTQSGTHTQVLHSYQGCDSTVRVQLTVLPLANLNVGPLSHIVCEGAALTLTASAGGGPGCTFQWQVSTISVLGPWTDVPDGNAAQYAPPIQDLDLEVNYFYRVLYTCLNNYCIGTTPSQGIRVMVRRQPEVQVSPLAFIACVDEPVLLSAQTSGGAGACSLQWYSGPAPAGPWTPIAGATDSNYQPPTNELGTVYYIAQWACAGLGCDPAFPPVAAKVTTALPPDIAISPSDTIIHIGDTMVFLLTTLSGADTCSIQWQRASSPQGPWLNIAGATDTTYLPPSDSVGVQYYRVTYNCADGQGGGAPNCYATNSNVASLTVRSAQSIVIDTTDFVVCIDAQVTLRADTTGGTGFCAVQWQSAPASDGPWTDIPDADSLHYHAPTGQAGTSYYRAVFFCNHTGGADTSNVATVIVLDEMTLEFTVISPLCPGDLGSIHVQGNPAFGDFTFTWSTGEIITGDSSQITLDGLSPGLYCVTMTANNGCPEVSDCAMVMQPPPGITVIPNITPPSCSSSADGAISPAVFGGTSPYTFVWSTGSETPSISNLPSGAYSLTIVDANGCEYLQDYQLDPALTADAGADNAICNNPDVELQGSASLSGPNIGYAWYAPDGTLISDQPIVTVSEGGLYRFRVTNSEVAGCYSEDEVFVQDYTGIVIPEMSMTLIACNVWRLSGLLPPDYSGPIDFEWTFPDGSMSTGLFITTTESGVYQLRISIPGAGCEVVLARFIEVGNNPCAEVRGRVAFDENDNCIAEADEDGLANWMVRAVGLNGVFFAITDGTGAWQLSLPLGNYAVSALPPTPSWTLCAASYPVALTAEGQTDTLLIPVRAGVYCPELDVQLSTAFLRRCFSNNLNLRVCNTGTETVQAPRITLVLDDFLEYQSSQFPPESINGQTVTWVIPPLGPSGCRQFWVRVSVSCDAVLGQSHCATVTATPDSLCTPALAAWSGASLEVSGECTGEAAVFKVRNAGTGDLTAPVQYIVMEDLVMLPQMPGTIDNLSSGAEHTFEFPANGSTWSFRLEQAPGHPFSAIVTAAIEGCGTNEAGTFSTGFVNQLPLPAATPATFTMCMPNIGAYDPNDKQAFPTGYGAKHFIYPGDPLQYKIRFQNTGTDTAFTVIIRDTLSPWLDIATLRPGPSSHEYRIDIAGERTLVFTFDNILLPDSTTNLEASQGYVDFSIRTADSIPLHTRIENSAAIYFDFNEPIITNTVFHTIGRNFFEQVSATFYPPALRPQWRVFPNPTSDEAMLVLEEAAAGVKTAWLYDAFGRQVLRLPFEGDRCLLQLAGMAPGWYALRVTDAAGRSLGAGRVVLR